MKILSMITVLFIFFGCANSDSEPKNSSHKVVTKKESVVTGKIINGLRVYKPNEVLSGKLNAYRGDYIKIETDSSNPITFSIDTLKISHTFPFDESGKAYFKLKQTGIFDYKANDKVGKIEIIEYSQPNYKAVSAAEGAKIIENISPLILDVRTPQEYAAGHLENSKLIPVQVIQTEFKQILEYKDKPVFIYCASGNRSTVAARILINNGFTNIFNLSTGISGWAREGLKIVK